MTGLDAVIAALTEVREAMRPAVVRGEDGSISIGPTNERNRINITAHPVDFTRGAPCIRCVAGHAPPAGGCGDCGGKGYIELAARTQGTGQ